MEAKKILLLFAMKGEAEGVIKHFDLQLTPTEAPIVAYRNVDASLMVVLNGVDKATGVDRIGTDAATLACYMSIKTFAPDLIINCGTAGGFRDKGAAIGDVYLVNDKIIYNDRSIPINDAFTSYSLGATTPKNTKSLAQKLGFKYGSISSGNSIDFTDVSMHKMKEHGIVLKDMEAAAIANLCVIHKQEVMFLKAVTDLVDKEEAVASFVNNFNVAVANLTKGVVLLVEEVRKR